MRFQRSNMYLIRPLVPQTPFVFLVSEIENFEFFVNIFWEMCIFSKMLIFPRVFTVFTDPPLDYLTMFTLDIVLLQCWDFYLSLGCLPGTESMAEAPGLCHHASMVCTNSLTQYNLYNLS